MPAPHRLVGQAPLSLQASGARQPCDGFSLAQRVQPDELNAAKKLEARGLGSVSINARITAFRKLAVEAADNGPRAPELAAGITRVKGARIRTCRLPHDLPWPTAGLRDARRQPACR